MAIFTPKGWPTKPRKPKPWRRKLAFLDIACINQEDETQKSEALLSASTCGGVEDLGLGLVGASQTQAEGTAEIATSFNSLNAEVLKP